MTPPNTAWNSESEKAHGANWREWLGHLKDKPAVGLELGTWMGESAEWMLDNIFTHPSSRYHCVDTFAGSDEHHLAGIDCAHLERYARHRLGRFGLRCQIFKATSDHAMRSMYRDCAFDFIYVDAAHDAQNVLRDAVLGFDLLRIGGTLIFDDYEWSVMPDPVDCPKMAVDAFLDCYGKRIEVLGMGWQVALRKLK